MYKINQRKKTLILIGGALTYLLLILFWGSFVEPYKYEVNYSNKFLQPSLNHIFGTDFLGRDMFWRTIKALSNSMIIGIISTGISSVIALVLGVSSALIGGSYDRVINWLIDLSLGIPHLVLLILISFMLGKGGFGVTVGIALTHWPGLTRIVRSEVIQLINKEYVQLAYKLGKSNLYIAKEHILPNILPIYIVGGVLLFPHTILHESSITFLGFGLSLEVPTIGGILSEAMKHLATGKWWLGLFPGIMLLVEVMLFQIMGEKISKLTNPNSGNE